MSAVEQVKRYYQLFAARDRVAMEAALADDFRFSSPRDDRIDKTMYFERCWPNGDRLADFEIENAVADGDRVFVRYTARRKADGVRFRNVEVMTLRDGKLAEVEVYFGRDLA